MKNPTYTSDGDEIAIAPRHSISTTPTYKYASVFLSVDKKRIGIRLEQCRSFGKPYVVWVDSKAGADLAAALADISERLRT